MPTALDVARLPPPWLRERTGSVSPADTPLSVMFPTLPLNTRVQIALGADLSADPATWAWVDITEFVRYDSGISLSVGRRDESSSVAPGTATMKLDNRDGRFSRRNPNSPYYGLLSKNTPIWVTLNAGSGEKTRIEMFVNEWPTRWSDMSATDSTVTIQCAGILRRLQQGNVLKSPLRRTLLGTSLVAYWPMEDGADSTSIASALPGGTPIPAATTLTFTTGPAGSDGALDLVANTAEVIATAHADLTSVTQFQVEFVGVSDQAALTLMLQIQATADGLSTNTGLSAASADGLPHYRAVSFTQTGSDVVVNFYVDGVFSSTSTFTSTTIKPGIDIYITAGNFTTGVVTLSHLSVHSTVSDSTTRADAADGHAGELAHVRMTRLATEEGMVFATTAATSVAMGPQSSTTFIDLLRECADADLGMLYEKRWGLAYKSRHEFYNQGVGLALDFDQGHIGDVPEPTDDDQRLRNRWTVSRTGGSEYTAEEDTGPTGTGPEGPGVYDDSATINVETEAQLVDQANWRVHLGTVDEDRWPAIGLNFAASPTLIDPFTSLGYGARMTVDNPPPQMPPDQLDLIIEGYAEAWDPFIWVASLNTSPASPYRVAIVSDPAADQEIPRIGSGTAVLAASYTSSDTSFSVTTGTGGLWTTLAADFPMDIAIGGERIRLSAISGAASPQTFTVSARSVNGVVKAQAAGARVEPWRTATVGL